MAAVTVPVNMPWTSRSATSCHTCVAMPSPNMMSPPATTARSSMAFLPNRSARRPHTGAMMAMLMAGPELSRPASHFTVSGSVVPSSWI
jgi:hypothetical protein